ncbi:NADPH-dependent FMN reductase [Neobacillus pocheonensis]|uniref:NADPH-dependent FMN reductase n=1 Tax=Neobacillus pocheonensis TaxID=363869 RepID=UPI003D293FC2
MSNIVIISGSPATLSRSSAISAFLESILIKEGNQVSTITVRNLPPEDLIYANFNSPAIQQAKLLVEQAEAVIIVSPVYKASYPGVLKTFLDLLPEKGLEGKIVFPVATGGTYAHLLSLEYSFKPLLSVLGARESVESVYMVDSQFTYSGQEITFVDSEIEQRLKSAVGQLLGRLQRKELQEIR